MQTLLPLQMSDFPVLFLMRSWKGCILLSHHSLDPTGAPQTLLPCPWHSCLWMQEWVPLFVWMALPTRLCTARGLIKFLSFGPSRGHPASCKEPGQCADTETHHSIAWGSLKRYRGEGHRQPRALGLAQRPNLQHTCSAPRATRPHREELWLWSRGSKFKAQPVTLAVLSLSFTLRCLT